MKELLWSSIYLSASWRSPAKWTQQPAAANRSKVTTYKKRPTTSAEIVARCNCPSLGPRAQGTWKRSRYVPGSQLRRVAQGLHTPKADSFAIRGLSAFAARTCLYGKAYR